MGASRPWPEVMKVMTGQEKMDASAIREYFKPLEDWLNMQLETTGETPGWKWPDFNYTILLIWGS